MVVRFRDELTGHDVEVGLVAYLDQGDTELQIVKKRTLIKGGEYMGYSIRIVDKERGQVMMMPLDPEGLKMLFEMLKREVECDGGDKALPG